MISYILALLVGLIILGLDQYTKYFIISNYTLGASSDFLPGIIDITYIHNKGGAWGMLSGHTWLLVSVTVIVMLVCVALLLKYGARNKLMFWAITLVLSGGIGNMIDRIFRDGNVIDFLHFEFMPDFPVFNVADCAIVIGAGLLILYFLAGIIRDAKVRHNPPEEESATAPSNSDENGI